MAQSQGRIAGCSPADKKFSFATKKLKRVSKNNTNIIQTFVINNFVVFVFHFFSDSNV